MNENVKPISPITFFDSILVQELDNYFSKKKFLIQLKNFCLFETEEIPITV
jgi:hypothetical protein